MRFTLIQEWAMLPSQPTNNVKFQSHLAWLCVQAYFATPWHIENSAMGLQQSLPIIEEMQQSRIKRGA